MENKTFSIVLKGYFLSVAVLMYYFLTETINLGIFNLLPLPALDGGRIIFILIELVTRKPVPQKYEGLVHTIGLVLLLGFMLLITAKDIIALIVG